MKLFKSIWNIVLRLFGKKKFFDIDGDGKVETLREEINGVFSQFKKMNDKLNQVNDQLKDVIDVEMAAKLAEQLELEKIIKSAEARMRQNERVIQKAEAEITANERLKEKVSEFIVE